MKVLITGGNSSVGISLKKFLIHTHEVYTSGRKDCDLIWDWNADIEEWLFPEGIDAVIHTAASFGGDDFLKSKEAIEFNTTSILKLAELSKRKKVRHLIHISSIFSLLRPESPFYNFYSLSKSYSERILKLYLQNSKVNYTILRPSQLYGVGEGFKKNQPFFYFVIDQAKNGNQLNFYGSKSPKRNYLFVDDLSKIILLVLNKQISGIYNCTHPIDVSYEEIAKIVYKKSQKEPAFKYDVEKANLEDNIFKYDDTLYRKIDYFPDTSLEKGLAHILGIKG